MVYLTGLTVALGKGTALAMNPWVAQALRLLSWNRTPDNHVSVCPCTHLPALESSSFFVAPGSEELLSPGKVTVEGWRAGRRPAKASGRVCQHRHRLLKPGKQHACLFWRPSCVGCATTGTQQSRVRGKAEP